MATKPSDKPKFKIESGIPIPTYGGASRSQRMYPFDELEVGQSFFVPGKTPGGISGTKSQAQRRTGATYKMRSVDGGVRVWRVS